MSHAGTYPSQGEEEEETTTTSQNTNSDAIGQNVLQVALGNLQALLQQNAPASSPPLIVPPSVTNVPQSVTNVPQSVTNVPQSVTNVMPSVTNVMPAEKEVTPLETGITITETAAEEDAGSGMKRAVPEKKLPPNPEKPTAGRRRGIGEACKYLRRQKVFDFEITTLPELIEYIKGQSDNERVAGMVKAYNACFPEDETEHLDASAIKGNSEGSAAKKLRVTPPFDFASYWAPGQHGTSQLNAVHHYTKHQEDGGFSCGSAEDYTQQARTFISQNSRNAQSQKGDENKTIICTYSRQQQKGLFLVRDGNNKILTFYVLTPATVLQYGTMTPEQYLATKVDDLDAVYTD